MGAARTGERAIALPRGTVVAYSSAGRRVRERDRDGHDLARLAWRQDGALERASVLIPDGSWLTIEPRATVEAPWGLCDRLWHRGAPLTVFAALDYSCIAFIPPLAEPTRLPAGGGTAVLNLIASLAADQGVSRLAYRGPYASEQLFLALLESFRHDGGAGNALAAFMNGNLAWMPAPHERRLAPGGVWIQMRDGIEKVVWQGRFYHRPLCQGVQRHAPRRIREAAGHVLCSLWALGLDLEDHLRMDASGDAVEVLPVGPDVAPAIAVPSTVLAGVAAAVAARSAPALGPPITAVARTMVLEWGPVTRDLARLEGARLRVSSRLLPVIRARMGTAATSHERALVALEIVGELAHLVGDALRARAQAHLAALPPEAQAMVLESHPETGQEEYARAIGGAVRALLAGPPSRDRVQDQLHVEGDERADREG